MEFDPGCRLSNFSLCGSEQYQRMRPQNQHQIPIQNRFSHPLTAFIESWLETSLCKTILWWSMPCPAGGESFSQRCDDPFGPYTDHIATKMLNLLLLYNDVHIIQITWVCLELVPLGFVYLPRSAPGCLVSCRNLVVSPACLLQFRENGSWEGRSHFITILHNCRNKEDSINEEYLEVIVA